MEPPIMHGDPSFTEFGLYTWKIRKARTSAVAAHDVNPACRSFNSFEMILDVESEMLIQWFILSVYNAYFYELVEHKALVKHNVSGK